MLTELPTPEEKVEWAKRVEAAHDAMKALNEYVPTYTKGREASEEESNTIASFQNTELELSEILLWVKEGL